ncbi:PAS domain-containing protein [Patescibacteria group bacterium]|nr:MAG: PAS domain-containing protein [Patescibacteria group bacterium]
MAKDTPCGTFNMEGVTFEMGDFMYDILNNISESIMIVDREFKITYANETLLSVLGMDNKDVIGSCCYKITHGLDDICSPPDHKCPIAEFYESGKSERFIHKHQDAAGKHFYTEVTAYPIKDVRDEVVGFVHISRDLSSDVIRTIQNLKKIDEAGGEVKELKDKIKKAGL